MKPCNTSGLNPSTVRKEDLVPRFQAKRLQEAGDAALGQRQASAEAAEADAAAQHAMLADQTAELQVCRASSNLIL